MAQGLVEEQLRRIIDAMPALIAYVDRECRYRFNSRSYTDWFGEPAVNLHGRPLREVLGEAAFEALRPRVEAVLSGQRVTFEATLPYRSGPRFVHVDYIPDFGPKGEVRGFYALINDQSERMRFQEQLQASEDRYRILFESIDQGFCIIELLFDGERAVDYRFLEVNRAFERHTGLDDVVGKRMRELVPDHEERWFQIYGSVAVTGESIRFEHHAQALARTFDVYAFRTQDPALRRVAVLFSDITGRRQAEESRARLAAIVESSDDAIVSKTLDGIITSWNQGAQRLFGYTADEAIGKHITLIIPPERHSEEEGVLARLRRGEKIDHFETVRQAKDGRRMNISLTVSPIHASDGRVIGASKVARDVTDRKLAEQALQEADRRKNEFLATLAHELRNPLAPIRNSLHLLRLQDNSPAAERVHDMLERQVTHLVRLVDDLLEISRITSGKIELRKEPVELAAVVRTALEISRPVIDASGHQLAIALPQEPITVEADPVRLSQIVANLLNNAAKYTDPGGQIWLTADRQAGEAVILVRDTGIGLAADVLPHVFDMFTQVDRDHKRAQGGLGIGLALVKRLAELHGGRVEARSEGTGKGSEFSIYLPLARHRTTVAPTAVLTPAGPGGQPRRRVLIVDDNRDAAASLALLLKLLGSEVQTANDGPSALQTAEAFRPDLVLLDLGMPGMSGFEVARRLRAHPELCKVTLIALTGWGQEEDRRRTQEAGFDNHLVKPVDLTALSTIVAGLTDPTPHAELDDAGLLAHGTDEA